MIQLSHLGKKGDRDPGIQGNGHFNEVKAPNGKEAQESMQQASDVFAAGSPMANPVGAGTVPG